MITKAWVRTLTAPSRIPSTRRSDSARQRCRRLPREGLPLYYYLNDTAAKWVVTGGLAALWPPLTSPSPAAT